MADVVPVLNKDITIKGGISLAELTGLRIEERLNEHATAYISGILREKTPLSDVYGLGMGANISVTANIEGEDKILFTGFPVNIEIKCLTGVTYLEMILKSYSYKLDIKKVSRSFQDTGNPYKNIFTKIVGDEYGGQAFDAESQGRQQERLIVQYEETDWAFLKRLTSQLNIVISPHMEMDMPQIYFGIPKGSSHQAAMSNHAFLKAIDEYLESASNYPGWSELDFCTNSVESNSVYRIFDGVTHNGLVFLVAERVSELRKGILINTYRLKPESRFKQNIQYNENLTGLSVEGTVIATERDKMKLHLSIDKQQDEGKAYWFDFNTPFTAEGHKGMYVMPEKGNRMQLYFPARDEARGYVRTVLRLDGESNPKTKDPDTKYFETAWSKELKLCPKGVQLTTTHGKMHVRMTEEDGIEIKSDKDILVHGPEIQLSGDKINAKAGDKVYFKTNSSSALIDTVVHMKGVEKAVFDS